MSGAKEFFRHCPACGHRFHIKIVGEKLVGERTTTREPTETSGSPVPFGQFGPQGTGVWAPDSFNDNVRITIDVKEFQYTYRCGHCGHTWSEEREEVSKEPQA